MKSNIPAGIRFLSTCHIVAGAGKVVDPPAYRKCGHPTDYPVMLCMTLKGIPNFPAPRADLSFLCRGGYVALCCTRSTTPKNINLGNCEASVGA
ncbi:hypothetical protein Pst134EB_001736 [Puccinia striiformis f. sp. tritici]|nr:hypothetical protein Pst134EB_001736 [Puccinia striiformis f. sp. tritici]